MPVIIKQKKHYLTRLPLWLALVIFIGLSPFIIGFIGAWITEATTNQPCHEGNCEWMVIPWFGFISLPLGAFGLLVLFIISVSDSIALYSKN
ncbi:hypothetical protein OO013_16360 [Mangrovivirga sp. M17]|uniref:Uncharacterized protein n=1 Tax=Mangrovivirga halotolerans TaxID=2993936 RepID=A0ABT3RUK5_9BACT|nr:hypothetical protein [Mangrovivirga halotolerans]MCX2745454.1 hypothetical protein [Mangrovivirga halotolerans]